MAVATLWGEFVFKEQFKGYVVCFLYKYSFFFGFQNKENWGLGGPITMRWVGGWWKKYLPFMKIFWFSPTLNRVFGGIHFIQSNFQAFFCLEYWDPLLWPRLLFPSDPSIIKLDIGGSNKWCCILQASYHQGASWTYMPSPPYGSFPSPRLDPRGSNDITKI